MADELRTIDATNSGIKYAPDVISTIAGLAATDCAGVAGMSGGLVGGIAELLGRKNLTKGVKAEVGTEQAALDLFIIVSFGQNIPAICREVQSAVVRAVESMTDLKVVEVNVYVQGIDFEKDPAEELRVH